MSNLEEVKGRVSRAKLERIVSEAQYTLLKTPEGSEQDVPTVRADALTKMKLVNYLLNEKMR